MVEKFHHQHGGGKIPPCHIHLSWWNFPTCLQMVEKFQQVRWNFFHHMQAGGKIPPSASGGKFHLQRYGGIFPPSTRRWKKYNHGISTSFGGISHYLQAGGTILPYQGKHLLIIGVHSVNTVEWCAHQSHCLINNQIPIKSLYRPKT